MYKLVLLIPDSGASPSFDSEWPAFLKIAERIPGLKREATSRTTAHIFGSTRYDMMHELFFDTRADLEFGLDSARGRQAADILHRITKGQVVIFVADHKEDDIANILKYQPQTPALPDDNA